MTIPLRSSGLASVTDLSDGDMSSALTQLRSFQHKFLETDPHPKDYDWPRTPTEWWSRIWEYPYTWLNLSSLLSEAAFADPIVDFGSAVTAFPFFIAANTGRRVICADLSDFRQNVIRAASALHLENQVSFVKTEPYSIPLPDCSVGCLYSVSVIEHILEPGRMIPEIARVLRSNGILILTMDVSSTFDEKGGIGPRSYENLRRELDAAFIQIAPIRPVHPALALTSINSPIPLRQAATLRTRITSTLLHKLKGKKDPLPWWKKELYCEGYIGKKR